MKWLTRYPGWVIGTCLVLVAALASGIAGVQYNSVPRSFQGHSSPPIIELEAIEAKYVQDHSIMIMLRPSTGTVFEPQHLTLIRELTEQAWGLPYVKRVDSIANFQYVRADGDELFVEDLFDSPDDMSGKELERRRGYALTEPRLRGFLVSADGRAAAVNLTYAIDIEQPSQIQQANEAVNAVLETLSSHHPDVAFSTTGYVAMAQAWYDANQSDFKYLYPLTALLMVTSMVVIFRSLSAALATFLVGVLSVLAALGVVGHFNGVLYPPTVVGALMLLMLALADAIHVVTTVRRNLAKGMDRREAVVDSVVFNFNAIALTSVTTAIGFLAFITSELEGMHLMGYYVAFGILVAWLLSVSFLPAMLIYCPMSPVKEARPGRGYRRLAAGVLRYRHILLLATGPAVLASIYCIQLNEVNDNMAEYVRSDQVFRQDMAAVEQHLTGTASIVLDLQGLEGRGVSDPDFMAEVELLTDWLRRQPEVRHVASYTDTMKQLNRSMHGDNPDYYRLPASPELAAQYLLFYQISLPYGLDLNNQISMDEKDTRLVIVIDTLPIMEIRALARRITAWMGEHTPLLQSAKPSGESYVTSEVMISNMVTMLGGAASAIILIGLILLFAFRALVPGLLSVVMVVSPIMVTFGIWGLTVGFAGLAASVSVCLVIGIVVDNAVHFINKHNYAITQLGKSNEEAIVYCFETVGPALLTTTVVMCLGFGVLLLSVFSLNSTLGGLVVLSLTTALAGCFTLLPALLMIGRDPLARLGFRL